MIWSLKATWILHLNAADLSRKQNWAKLAYFIISKVVRLEDIRGFSIHKGTDFLDLKNLHPFFKEVVMGYWYSNAVDFEQFCATIYRQSL